MVDVHEVSAFRYGARPATVPPSRLDRSVDVAVVGMDNMGLGAAIELARSGRQVVMLDTGSVGDNTSANSLGHLARRPPNDRLAIERRADAIVALQSEAFDWTAELIDRQAIACDLTTADIGDGDDVALVDPFALNQGLVRAALDAGVTLYDYHRVLRLQSRRGPGHELRTSRGRVRALDVVVTEAAQLTTLIPWLSPRTGKQRRLLMAGPPSRSSDRPPFARIDNMLVRSASLPQAGGDLTIVSVPSRGKGSDTASAERRLEAVTHRWPVEHIVVADGWPRIGRTEGVWYAIGGGHDHLATEAYLGSRLGAWVGDADDEVDVPVLADLRLERMGWGKLRP